MPTYTSGANGSDCRFSNSETSLPKCVEEYLVHGVGEGERNTTLFRMACQCLHTGFSQSGVEEMLVTRAIADGLSEREARQTITSAFEQERRAPPSGYSAPPPLSNAQRTFRTAAKMHAAPQPPSSPPGRPLPDPIQDGFRVLLENCYLTDERIVLGKGSRNSEGDTDIDAGTMCSRESWLKRIAAKPIEERYAAYQDGLFLRINPMRGQGKRDIDVDVFRYALVAFDLGSNGQPVAKEVQYEILLSSGFPIGAILDSGNKSLQALIRLDAADRKEFDARYRQIVEHFGQFDGFDDGNKNPSRYFRCPGATRNLYDKTGNLIRIARQELLTLKVGPASWAEYEEAQQSHKRRTEAELQELFDLSTISGPDFEAVQIPPHKIIVTDWLKEGETSFIFAYRGTGKTWFTLALCVAVAEGTMFGPWSVPVAYSVLYVDGEMPCNDVKSRILAFGGKIPLHLHILQHEVLFQKGEEVMNLANPLHQRIILSICLARNIKVLVLDNLSCLFCGMEENEADEWEKVKSWLLQLRRHNISPVMVHHTGHDTTHMRGTSSREDAASTVLRLDSKKDDSSQEGAHFITRLTKHRGRLGIPDYEWIFEPVGYAIKVSVAVASRSDVFLQWIRDGLTRCEDIAKEMGISKGYASKLATKLIQAGKIRKNGREYVVI